MAYNANDVEIDRSDERSFVIADPRPAVLWLADLLGLSTGRRMHPGGHSPTVLECHALCRLLPVTVAGDVNFTNKLYTYTTRFTRLTPREALPDNQAGQSYYWFVQPCKTPTTCGPSDSDKAVLLATEQSFRKESQTVTSRRRREADTGHQRGATAWQDYFDTNVGSRQARGPVGTTSRSRQIPH